MHTHSGWCSIPGSEMVGRETPSLGLHLAICLPEFESQTRAAPPLLNLKLLITPGDLGELDSESKPQPPSPQPCVAPTAAADQPLPPPWSPPWQQQEQVSLTVNWRRWKARSTNLGLYFFYGLNSICSFQVRAKGDSIQVSMN